MGCIPHIKTRNVWLTPHAKATAATLVSGCGPLVRTALIIGVVTVGRNAANRRGPKKRNKAWYSGAGCCDARNVCWSGRLVAQSKITVSAAAPADTAIAAIGEPAFASTAEIPKPTIMTVAAPVPVPIQIRRGRLIRKAVPYKCVRITASTGNGTSAIKASRV